MISVVIPHFNRHQILFKTLERFNHQLSKDFEIIVVDDWSYPEMPEVDVKNYNYPLRFLTNINKGPANARNYGASMAHGDIVLFIGDDCIPDNDLIFQHALWHHNSPTRVAVQGYSPFHPQIFDNRFMWWLDKSGMQANWNALRNEDGSAKFEATGYCLTTNYSINKEMFFEAGGFPTQFPNAAWEDVAFGYHLTRIGMSTVFNPSARNWHYHSYNPETFAKRQRMVGTSLLTLLETYPELSRAHFDPGHYNDWVKLDLALMIENSMDLFFSSNAQLIIETAEKTWGGMLHVAMQHGIKDVIDDSEWYWVLPYLNNIEQPKHVFEIVNGIKNGHYGWVSHNMSWLTGGEVRPEVHAFIGDVYLHYRLKDFAANAYRKSLELAPVERAKKGLRRLKLT